MTEALSTSTDSGALVQELRDLLARANVEHPKASDVAELREFLSLRPSVWRGAIGMARLVESALVKATSGGEGGIETRRQELALMRDELGARSASPLELLLIERVALTWLRLQFVEMQATCSMKSGALAHVAEHWEKRLTQAQKRFLQAVESLARVRKLIATTPQRAKFAAADEVQTMMRQAFVNGMRRALAERETD
jgi:hypothetical protein